MADRSGEIGLAAGAVEASNAGMADVGKQVLGLMTLGAVALVVFAPLGVSLCRAAASGRTRVIGRAFLAGFVVALGWLAVAIVLRHTVSAPVAGWWLLAGPWAAAGVAEWARRKALRVAETDQV